MEQDIVVSAINRFSIRSCKGESLNSVTVTANGLDFDRLWRLVTPEGKFLTQRECPKMALVQPSVVDGKLAINFIGSDESAPACVPTVLCFLVKESVLGVDQGDAVADWLTRHLGRPARLLRVTVSGASPVFAEDTLLDFARPDMLPVLFISEESLADLNSRLTKPVPMNRFRPNFVIRGGKAYAEESWQTVRIGEVTFVASTEPCGRCSMILVDQETGEKSDNEPLHVLAKYRRFPELGNVVIFGKYMVPVNCGTVSVGDKVYCAA